MGNVGAAKRFRSIGEPLASANALLRWSRSAMQATLQARDQEEQGKRQAEQEQSEAVGRRVVELLHGVVKGDGGNLGLAREGAADYEHDTELA